MQEVYLGALTPTCLGTTRTRPCSPPFQNTNITSSVFFQCGEKVARFVSRETREANVTTEIDEMMTSMEEVIVEAYNFTCSIGEELLVCLGVKMAASQNPFDRLILQMFNSSNIGEELLECLGVKMAASQNPFDRLILQMFNSSKFASIVDEGCQPSLLNDLRLRLEYILSMILSDPRSSSCIESLNSFDSVLMGEVDVDLPNASYPYCRIWADFSECIESKLSCSSPDLANKWRQFTVESLNLDCQLEALHQQEMNPIGRLCDINRMEDSALSLCGMSFMASSLARENEAPGRPLQDVVMGEIQYFCANQMDESLIMIECLRTTLSASSIKIDSIASRIFNLSALKEISTNICSLSEVTRTRMGCIIESMKVWKDTVGCLDLLKEAFNVSVYHDKPMDELIHRGCRGWKDFSNCILPHINACDVDLSMAWSDLSHQVLMKECQTYIAQTARQNMPDSCDLRVYSKLLTLLCALVILVFYKY